MGVPYTSSPHTLLVYSYEMMNQGRDLRAKEFIDKALKKYSKANDVSGMAEAYHAYGNYYKVIMYVPVRATMYPNPGKEDPLKGYVKYTKHQDYGKSEESFRKAIELFSSLNNYAGLSKSYLGLGNVLSLQEKDNEAMEAYDKSLMYYYKMKEKDPQVELPILTDFKNGLEMINAFRDSGKHRLESEQ